jgi:hypothetical protein
MEPMKSTHAVFNQTPPLVDYNLYTSDLALQQAVPGRGTWGRGRFGVGRLGARWRRLLRRSIVAFLPSRAAAAPEP